MKNNPFLKAGAAAAGGIPAWLSAPQKLPWDVALRITELAVVPVEGREDCARSLGGLVRTCCGWDSRSLQTKPTPALRQAADAARLLQAAVCNLSKDDREWLQGFAYYDAPHTQELLRTLPTTLSRLAGLLSMAIGRFSPLEVNIAAAVPKKRGRNQGTFNEPIFHCVVNGLLLCVFAEGGKLTLDKNLNTGTLIEVLTLLRPHLPNGVIPKVLPLGTIQKIKTAFSKSH
jgi:hypothetical protein